MAVAALLLPQWLLLLDADDDAELLLLLDDDVELPPPVTVGRACGKTEQGTLIDGQSMGATVRNKDHINTLERNIELPEAGSFATQLSRVMALSFFLAPCSCSICCWARAAFGRGLPVVMVNATSPSLSTSMVRTT